MLVVLSLKAQHIGINTANPHPSAVLDVVSENMGVLIPRMNSITRNSIANPATSLLVFDTDSVEFFFYDGLTWRSLASNASSLWLTKYRALYTRAGNVGIGTDSVMALVHLHSDTIAPEIRWSTPNYNSIVGLDETDGTIYVGRDSAGHIDRQLTIDTAGRVGMGTLNPEEELHIKSKGDDARIKMETASYKSIVGLDETDGTIVVGHEQGGVVHNTFIIDTSGRAGIGRVDTSVRFNIEGAVKSSALVLSDGVNDYTIKLDDLGLPDISKSINNFLDLYHTTAQSFTNTSIGVTWGGQRFTQPGSSAFNHTANSSEVEITREGYYIITYMLSFESSNPLIALGSEVETKLALKPASTGVYAAVDGSYTWTSTGINLNSNRVSTTKQIILYMEPGDKIQVVVTRVAGSDTINTLPQGCSMVVERL